MPLITQTTPRKRYRRYCEAPPTHGCPRCLAVVYEGDEDCLECKHARPDQGWPTPSELDWPELGTTLHEHYLVTQVLNPHPSEPRYRVISTRMIKDFSLKLIKLSEDPAQAQEAQRTLELHSLKLAKQETPHLIKLHDLAQTEHNELLIVLDLLCGLTLEQHINRGLRFTTSQCQSLMKQLLQGLQNLHRQDLIHGALHPGGVMIDELLPGHLFAILTDPGINHLFHTRAQLAARTKPRFLCPEYAQEDQPLTMASDIYALGRLYELIILGEWTEAAPSLEDAINQHHPDIEETLTSSLAQLIEQMCAPEPSERLTIEQVQHKLEQMSWRLTTMEALDAPRQAPPMPMRTTQPPHLVLAIRDKQLALALEENLIKQHPSWELTQLSSAQSVIELAQHRRIDLLLFDVHLNGSYDLTPYAQLQASHAIPTILAMPQADDRLEIQLMKFGAMNVISLADSRALNLAKLNAIVRRAII